MTKKRTSEHWPDIAAFKREGENWLTRQVAFDAGLPPQAMRLANIYRLHVNFELGYAEVSAEKVAEALGISPDTVSRANKALVARGHCDIAYGKGRGQTNRVCWILKPQTNTGSWRGLAHENITGLKENPASVRGKPRKSAAKTPQGCGTNILSNNSCNIERDAPSGARPSLCLILKLML